MKCPNCLKTMCKTTSSLGDGLVQIDYNCKNDPNICYYSRFFWIRNKSKSIIESYYCCFFYDNKDFYIFGSSKSKATLLNKTLNNENILVVPYIEFSYPPKNNFHIEVKSVVKRLMKLIPFL